jgi:hypothetical protein
MDCRFRFCLVGAGDGDHRGLGVWMRRLYVVVALSISRMGARLSWRSPRIGLSQIASGENTAAHYCCQSARVTASE